MLDALSNKNESHVEKYVQSLWAGSDDFKSSDILNPSKDEVIDTGEDAVLNAPAQLKYKTVGQGKAKSQTFTYAKWQGDDWTGTNHKVKYYPTTGADGKEEPTVTFDSSGKHNFLFFGTGDDQKCAYRTQFHDKVADCDAPAHHGTHYTKDMGAVIDNNNDGVPDMVLDDTWICTTKDMDCTDANGNYTGIPMRGSIKPGVVLHKHTDSCYPAGYTYNGSTYTSQADADNAKESAKESAISKFKANHPNYDSYITAQLGSSEKAADPNTYINYILSCKGVSGKGTVIVNSKTKELTIENIYKTWTGTMTNSKVTYSKYNTTITIAPDKTQAPTCGMAEHYDEDYFKKTGEVRLYPWVSESNPGDYDTWYECTGHCPGHLTPLIDYSYVGDIQNLAAYDDTPMSELRTIGEKFTRFWDNAKVTIISCIFKTDSNTTDSLKQMAGLKNTSWNHWDHKDISCLTALIGDYQSGYTRGINMLSKMGINTGEMGIITAEDASKINAKIQAFIGTSGRNPEATISMLNNAIQCVGKYSYSQDKRCTGNYLDCSSFVAKCLNDGWGKGTISPTATTETFKNLPGTGNWTDIGQVKAGSILLRRNSEGGHVALAISVTGDKITYIDCNIACGGKPDGVNVREMSFSGFVKYGYNYINNDYAS
jgi:hypothetical protein